MYLCTFLQTKYPQLLDIVKEFNIVGKASNSFVFLYVIIIFLYYIVIEYINS